MADLLMVMAEQSLPRTEMGSLLDDLKANARLVQRTLSDPRQGALFKAMIAASSDRCGGGLVAVESSLWRGLAVLEERPTGV